MLDDHNLKKNTMARGEFVSIVQVLVFLHSWYNCYLLDTTGALLRCAFFFSIIYNYRCGTKSLMGAFLMGFLSVVLVENQVYLKWIEFLCMVKLLRMRTLMNPEDIWWRDIYKDILCLTPSVIMFRSITN